MRGGDPRRGRSGRGAGRCRSAGPLLLLLGAALGAGRGAGPAAAQDTDPCPPGTVLVNVGGGERADPAAHFVLLKELQAAAMGYVPRGVALGLDGSDELAAENVSFSEAIELGFADRLCKAIPRQGETYVGLLSSLAMPLGNYSTGPYNYPVTPADLEEASEGATAAFETVARESGYRDRYPGTLMEVGEESRRRLLDCRGRGGCANRVAQSSSRALNSSTRRWQLSLTTAATCGTGEYSAHGARRAPRGTDLATPSGSGTSRR